MLEQMVVYKIVHEATLETMRANLSPAARKRTRVILTRSGGKVARYRVERYTPDVRQGERGVEPPQPAN